MVYRLARGLAFGRPSRHATACVRRRAVRLKSRRHVQALVHRPANAAPDQTSPARTRPAWRGPGCGGAAPPSSPARVAPSDRAAATVAPGPVFRSGRRRRHAHDPRRQFQGRLRQIDHRHQSGGSLGHPRQAHRAGGRRSAAQRHALVREAHGLRARRAAHSRHAAGLAAAVAARHAARGDRWPGGRHRAQPRGGAGTGRCGAGAGAALGLRSGGLLGAFGASISTALAAAETREAAVVTFLVTASGVGFLGIPGAFWGLVAGIAVHLVNRARITR